MSAKNLRERQNWYIHLTYIRGEHEECLAVIDRQLKESAFCEYAIYVKGLILRRRGKFQESLQLFQSATCLNPQHVENLRQVGHALYLLGKHRQAIEVYDEALKVQPDSWSVFHNKGVCFTYLGDLDAAVSMFEAAKALQPHDTTWLQLGKVYERQGDLKRAVSTYRKALEGSPENPELLTHMGLLMLRLGQSEGALECLDSALSVDNVNTKAILAWGSIKQDNGDADAALLKYRIAAARNPTSAPVWNNVGMCFFGKGQPLAAVACLERALKLSPLEWIVRHNLGLVLLSEGHNASAFQCFHAAVTHKPDFGAACMFLAVCLSRLGDLPSACQAFERAIALEPNDHVVHLNYAIALYNDGGAEDAKARRLLAEFDRLFAAMGNLPGVEHDAAVISQSEQLRAALAQS